MSIKYNCENCGEIGETPEVGEARGVSALGVVLVNKHLTDTGHEVITAKGVRSVVRIHFYTQELDGVKYRMASVLANATN